MLFAGKSGAGLRGPSVCLVWSRDGALQREETAHNEEKGPQLTLTHSTHPSVQQEVVWPKFTLPHLPRHLFSLLGKHLEKCMRERGGWWWWWGGYICLNTSHLVRGAATTRTSADIYSPLVANCKGPGCLTERACSDLHRISLNHLWRLYPNTDHANALFWHQTHICVTGLINVT